MESAPDLLTRQMSSYDFFIPTEGGRGRSYGRRAVDGELKDGEHK